MFFYGINRMRYIRDEKPEIEINDTDKFHKTAFSTLKIKVPKTYAEFKFGEKVVQVINYLPTQEKEDIIGIAYQKAIINSSFNPILFNIYFLLNVVYSYTNLTFTDEQRKDEKKLYDIINSSGLLDLILQNIPNSEKFFFEENTKDYVIERLRQDYSAMGLFNNAVGAFNTFTKTISDKFSNVDENTMQTFIDMLPKLMGGNTSEQTT